MSNYKYIHFEKVKDKDKTSVWSCRNNKSNIELGIIKWHPAWRQYCYFPTIEAVYSKGCFKDIIDFIQKQMDARRECVKL